VENLSLDKYTKLIVKNRKIITLFMLGMFIFTIFYSLFFYKSNYQSSAKILIKNKPQISFVTELNANSTDFLPGENKNPILTQMEVLTSADIARNVINKLSKEEFLNKYPPDKMVKILKKHIKLKNPAGTDIIKMTVSWNKPDEAQKIAQAYIDSYYNYNVKVNQISVAQTKEYISKQLDKSNKELAGIREKIQNYRKNNESVNIEEEAGSTIEQISKLEGSISETNSKLASERGKSYALSNKIGITAKKALDNVAVGQDTIITTLRQNLYDNQQKFATLNAKYPPTNIQMKSLNDNILEIKNQINTQMIATVGKTLTGANSTIADPVRTQLVQDLIASQTNVRAFASEKAALENNLKELKVKLSKLPEKQKTLQKLLQDEAVTSSIVQTLNAKLIEAQIKQSEIVSGINIVENPAIPASASFPTLLHLFLIFELIGVLLGIATILGIYYIEDICQGTTELEEITQAPVFGVIPWLNSVSYKNYSQNSDISIAYQRIMTSLKIKSCKKNINAIAFSSAELEKKRSIISVNVAQQLAKSNNSVVVIDADYRDGCIEEEFGIKKQNNQDLTSLLINMQNMVNKGHQEDEIINLITGSLVQIAEYDNLFILPNINNNENPYEVLTTPAFQMLIEYLKKKFDFVLVDTPPMLAVPDAITISQNLDGIVLLCGIKTSRSNLRRIYKACKDNYIELLGTVARDAVPEFEVPDRQSIKRFNLGMDDELEPENS
jgi:polysaccharide biosynthesis transport protein